MLLRRQKLSGTMVAQTALRGSIRCHSLAAEHEAEDATLNNSINHIPCSY